MNPEGTVTTEEVFDELLGFDVFYLGSMSLQAHRAIQFVLIEGRTSLTNLDIPLVSVLGWLDEVVVIDDGFAVVALETVVALELLLAKLAAVEDAVFMHHVAAFYARYHLISVFQSKTVAALLAIRTDPCLNFVETNSGG